MFRRMDIETLQFAFDSSSRIPDHDYNQSRGTSDADSATRRITVFPQMSRSCLGRPSRVDCPAARIIPAILGRSGGFATDRSGGFGQRPAHASFRTAMISAMMLIAISSGEHGADIETDRSANPGQRLSSETRRLAVARADRGSVLRLPTAPI